MFIWLTWVLRAAWVVVLGPWSWIVVIWKFEFRGLPILDGTICHIALIRWMVV